MYIEDKDQIYIYTLYIHIYSNFMKLRTQAFVFQGQNLKIAPDL